MKELDVIKTKYLTDVETWTVDELFDSLGKTPTSNKTIEVPSYQRSIVWKKSQKQLLIDSIKKGMPVGSLLLYSVSSGTENKKTYHLIDGLQRASSIKDYVENPTKFFSQENLDDDFLNTIHNFLQKIEPIEKTDLSKHLVTWIQSRRGFEESDGFSSFNLVDYIDNLIGEKFEKKDLKSLTDLLPPYLEDIRRKSDINRIKIPVLIYSGDSSNLPEIFERMNSKGTQLNKYQIFAATWTTYESIKISNLEIVEKIKAKYDALVEEGLDVANYEPENFNTSDFNYFEYFFGLGKYLTDKVPSLFGSSAAKDEADSVGFNLGCICLNHDLKDMDKLPEKLKDLNIASLEEKIIDSANITNKILKPFISLKANKKNGSPVRTNHSEYQILSIIGKVFNSKYVQREEGFVVQETWKEVEKRLEKNIPFHYLYDILRNHWSGTGDSKAIKLVTQDTYEHKIDKDRWETTLDEWHESEKAKKEKTRAKINSNTILFLKYIYTHLLSAHEELSTQEFEVEHICPVGQLKPTAQDLEGLPISAVSNLCLIPKSLNREKNDKTFYEYYKIQVESEEITDLQAKEELKKIEDRSFTTKEELEFLENLSEESKDAYFEFLDRRYEKIKEKFFDLNSIDHS